MFQATNTGIQILHSLDKWLPKVVLKTEPQIWQQQTVTDD